MELVTSGFQCDEPGDGTDGGSRGGCGAVGGGACRIHSPDGDMSYSTFQSIGYRLKDTGRSAWEKKKTRVTARPRANTFHMRERALSSHDTARHHALDQRSECSWLPSHYMAPVPRARTRRRRRRRRAPSTCTAEASRRVRCSKRTAIARSERAKRKERDPKQKGREEKKRCLANRWRAHQVRWNGMRWDGMEWDRMERQRGDDEEKKKKKKRTKKRTKKKKKTMMMMMMAMMMMLLLLMMMMMMLIMMMMMIAMVTTRRRRASHVQKEASTMSASANEERNGRRTRAYYTQNEPRRKKAAANSERGERRRGAALRIAARIPAAKKTPRARRASAATPNPLPAPREVGVTQVRALFVRVCFFTRLCPAREYAIVAAGGHRCDARRRPRHA